MLRGLKQYTSNIVAVVTVTDDGRTLVLAEVRPSAKGQVLARIEGVADRTAAEGLTGRTFSVARAQLPAADDEFYLADLIGLEAVAADGAHLGRVAAVHEFGAAPVIELALAAGGTLAVPFSRAAVPQVDLARGRVVVVPIEDAAP